MSTFQAEALATLSDFEMALAGCSEDHQPDLDVSDLRVPTLQQELEAVSRDEAAGIAGPREGRGATAVDAAASLATDGDAGRVTEPTSAGSDDAATLDGGRVLQLEAPPPDTGAAQEPGSPRAEQRPAQETESPAAKRSGAARTRSRSAAKPAEAVSGKGCRRRPPKQSSQGKGAKAEPAPVVAAAAEPLGLTSATEAFAEPDADAATSAATAIDGGGSLPQGVRAVGRRLKMYVLSTDSWRVGKVTHFNRRSGKHTVLFESGGTDVRDLAAERVVCLPDPETSEAEDGDKDEGTDAGATDGEPALLGAKRSRSQAMAVALVPPSQRRVDVLLAYAHVTGLF